jgi:hypothetical protein
MVPCVLMNQTYYLAQNTGPVCTIIGKYVIVTNSHTRFTRMSEQRIVAVWRQDGERLWLMHLSNTNPIGEWKVTENEHFPMRLNSYLMKYVDREIQRKKGSQRLAITDCERTIHYIDQDEIAYLQSDNKYTEIFLETTMIRTRTMLKEFSEKLGDQFLKISRINIVNMAMVARIQDQTLILLDGRELPIPFKKSGRDKRTHQSIFPKPLRERADDAYAQIIGHRHRRHFLFIAGYLQTHPRMSMTSSQDLYDLADIHIVIRLSLIVLLHDICRHICRIQRLAEQLPAHQCHFRLPEGHGFARLLRCKSGILHLVHLSSGL